MDIKSMTDDELVELVQEISERLYIPEFWTKENAEQEVAQTIKEEDWRAFCFHPSSWWTGNFRRSWDGLCRSAKLPPLCSDKLPCYLERRRGLPSSK